MTWSPALSRTEKLFADRLHGVRLGELAMQANGRDDGDPGGTGTIPLIRPELRAQLMRGDAGGARASERTAALASRPAYFPRVNRDLFRGGRKARGQLRSRKSAPGVVASG
jgi:hypothetical protein